MTMPCPVRVAADGPHQGQRGRVLDSGRQQVAGERPGVHQPVEMRMGERVGTVDRRERGQGAGCGQCARQFPHRERDHLRIDRALVWEVLVEGRSANAQLFGERSHGQGP
jgi:hypothetical protein